MEYKIVERMTVTPHLPEVLEARIPPIYSQRNEADPMVYARIVAPNSKRVWYVTEGSPEGDDFRFFGYIAEGVLEWNYFSLSDLKSWAYSSGIDIRWDKSFRPALLSSAEFERCASSHGHTTINQQEPCL
jgi:hypothetical protein